MSCRQKCHGRFAPIQFESDNCRKGREYVPIWKKDFNAPCFDICKDGDIKEIVFKKSCSNPCNPVMPCRDFTCKKTCMKVAPCVSACGKSCMFAPTCHDNGCKALDVCGSTRPCGSRSGEHFPGLELCSGPCSSPCSLLNPCHDIKNVFKRIRTDCRGMQPCGEETVGRFPLKPAGACYKPDHDFFFN